MFLDRDGVINELVYYPEAGVIDSPFTVELFHMLPGVGEAIRSLNGAGFKVVVTSNQPGVAKNHFTEETLNNMNQKMTGELAAQEAFLDGIYYCLHHPEGTNGRYRCQCDCRKPKPGLLLQAARELGIDLGQSYMVGDSLTDIKAGENAGCHAILIGGLKCDTCRLIDEQDTRPDTIVPDLWAAAQVILNSSALPDEVSEQSRWEKVIRSHLLESARIKELMSAACVASISQAALIISDSLKGGGKVMLCGNGGSAADCQHIAAELVGRLSSDRERAPMAAIALSTNTSNITAIGNDYGFEHIFARQVTALGKAGDVLIGISTSGKSGNIVQAVKVAKELGIKTIGFLGQTGILKEIVDLAIMVPSDNIQRIQEGHITIGHLVCEVAEQIVSPKQLIY